MEFHEKLQELRKSRGLTQEELAEDLYVSRTAVSKWESGRGYPNIDSLKEISKYFSVSIDDLLSSEKLLFIAEKEKKSTVRRLYDLLFGSVDVCSLILIILPFYPNEFNGFVYSVNLLAYEQTTQANRLVYWIMYILLILVGVIKILVTLFRVERVRRLMIGLSMMFSVILVLFLATTREVYALIVVFLLLVIKGILILSLKK